jgi:Tetratricopeptide repeat/Mitochondrial biogenesis AIM24
MQGGPGDRGRTSDARHRAAKVQTTEDFLFHLYRGSELLQDNRVHEAKDELEQALKLQPRDAKGQDLLAVVYFRLGFYPRAIEIYEELIQEYPREAALAQNLSLCYLKTGQPDKARTLLESLVMSQPEHLRAWAYLGLVHERLGDYQKARAAFQRGQQPGMARRMDDLLSSAGPARSLSVPPPEPMAHFSEPPPDSRPNAEAFSDLEREVTLVGIQPVARTTNVPPPLDAPADIPLSPFPSRLPGSGRNGPSIGPGADGSTEPLPIVPVPSISVGSPVVRTPVPRSVAGDALPLARLARELLLPFPSAPGLVLHQNGLVLVRVEKGFVTRLSQIQLLAAEGTPFKTSPLQRRMRNRTIDEPLGGSEAPLVTLAGAGCLALAPGENGRLWPFRMDGDFLFVREEVLAGFEDTVSYENGRLAAFDGEATALVQLRGKGGVVLRSQGAVVSLDIKADRSAIIARDTVLGWAGRLLPRELSPEEAPGGSTRLISFAGEGTVFAAASARMVGR